MKTVLLPQLHVFLAVARLKSFRGAARELGVSTAAVSKSVRQLEEQLRVVLLTRTTRSVSVTDAGRRLVESAGPAMGQALATLGWRWRLSSRIALWTSWRRATTRACG